MQIKISGLDDSRSPAGKVADAEIVFDAAEGPLAGLKLIGFAIWEQRSRSGSYAVTFPARSYSVNGERRSFALLRPVADQTDADRIRDLIIQAYQEASGQAEPTTQGRPTAERRDGGVNVTGR